MLRLSSEAPVEGFEPGRASDSVKSAQTILAALGLFADPVDGFCTTRFLQALYQFKAKYGLGEDWILDSRTAAVLASVNTDCVSMTSEQRSDVNLVNAHILDNVSAALNLPMQCRNVLAERAAISDVIAEMKAYVVEIRAAWNKFLTEDLPPLLDAVTKYDGSSEDDIIQNWHEPIEMGQLFSERPAFLEQRLEEILEEKLFEFLEGADQSFAAPLDDMMELDSLRRLHQSVSEENVQIRRQLVELSARCAHFQDALYHRFHSMYDELTIQRRCHVVINNINGYLCNPEFAAGDESLKLGNRTVSALDLPNEKESSEITLAFSKMRLRNECDKKAPAIMAELDELIATF